MTRFVMANRRAGKFQTEEKIASREAMRGVINSNFMAGASIVAENTPRQEIARQVVVFEANAAEMVAKAHLLPPDVIVEPEILHYTETMRLMEFLGQSREALDGPFDFGNTVTLNIRITGGGGPLEGARVILNLVALASRARSVNAVTAPDGRAQFEFSEIFDVSSIVVVPAGNFWTMVVRGPRDGDVIDCPGLPSANSCLGWWHERLGISKHAKSRGRGIKVGVADTGLGPNGNLEHAIDIGAFIGGLELLDGGADVDSHGSHVCGTIGAQPVVPDQFAGVAPGVKLFSARVFPPGAGASQADIANAIDALSRVHEVDLINLSLGSPQRSEIERDAIIDAAERGTLCVCAAANSDGPVEFPAAFPETLAISAIGLVGWGPAGSLASFRLPQDFERFGLDNLYHANFSCFGPEVTGAAPGVGIISTVPERFGLDQPYSAMDGTSMASPAACGALAAILSTDKTYLSLPRDEIRTAFARTRFRQACSDIGLDPIYQGSGMPLVN